MDWTAGLGFGGGGGFDCFVVSLLLTFGGVLFCFLLFPFVPWLRILTMLPSSILFAVLRGFRGQVRGLVVWQWLYALAGSFGEGGLSPGRGRCEAMVLVLAEEGRWVLRLATSSSGSDCGLTPAGC